MESTETLNIIDDLIEENISNGDLERELIIPLSYSGQRIDSALAALLPEFSRSQLSQWLKHEAITVNGKTCKPKEKIQGGEHILLKATPNVDTASLPNDIPLDIIYEDEHILVINKQAGLVVHPGAGNRDQTLVNALLFYNIAFAQVPRAGIIHRIDKDTTGLLIMAKTLTAHTQLVRQMQAREIQRDYLSLVYGHLISGGTIDTCYGRHPTNRLKMTVCKQGRQAITHYRLNKCYQHFTLLDVQLMTGRTHQIRVHMAHIQHPVVGDQVYFGRTRYPKGICIEIRNALDAMQRQALHAYSLSFQHPITDEEMIFTAPLPEDFQALLNVLENYDLP